MSADRPFLKKDFAAVVQSLLGDLASSKNGQPVFTDDTEGSVIRTLVEAFSREVAVAYQQLELVYRNGYLDTAEGIALENVVALLGIKRRTSGRIEGKVTFTFNENILDMIRIPSGVRVTGSNLPLFETVEAIERESAGTKDADVKVRSLEPYEQKIKAGSLTMMPRPIVGIAGVTNPDEFSPGRQEETDEELRERARQALKGTRQGTIPALKQFVSSLGFSKVRIQERLPERPGEVEIVIGDLDAEEEERLKWIRDRIEEIRPAGICVSIRGATRIFVQVTATLTMDEDRPAHEKKAIEAELIRKLVSYFDSLGPNENVRKSKVRNILAGHDSVMEVTNTAEEKNIIYPFVVGKNGEGELVDQSELMILNNGDNGDIFVSAAERAVLDLKKKPIRLTLEPPALDVWVDVTANLRNVSEKNIEDIKKVIKTQINSILTSTSRNEPYSYNTWFAKLEKEDLTGDIENIVFTVIHDRDGRVVKLKDGNDSDYRFADREIPQLRHIEIFPVESY